MCPSLIPTYHKPRVANRRPQIEHIILGSSSGLITIVVMALFRIANDARLLCNRMHGKR